MSVLARWLPIAALLALFATPALAEECVTVTVTKATVADIPKLEADAACFQAQADAALAEKEAAQKKRDAALARKRYRVNRVAELKALPPPPPPVVPTPGLPVIDDGLDVSSLLGPKSIPPSAAPDVVGAFRFHCGPGQILNDDPIVFPGQPGRSHPHQFFGNLSGDANSTYESLRRSGESTCMNEANRTLYWIAVMLDGKGHYVRPDRISEYYKRRPTSDPFCKEAAKACVQLPRGLSFIFGWDYTRPDTAQKTSATFKCVENDHPVSPSYPDLVEVAKVCKPGQQIAVTLNSPQCWNGVDLDSPDHQSHMSGMVRNRMTGKLACPATHPYIVAQFSMGVIYSIEEGDDPTLWHLSSDHMLPEALRRPGASFHADWFGAWNDTVLRRWHEGCINKLLNCSDGDLGDGAIMKRGKHYPQGVANPRLVPMP